MRKYIKRIIICAVITAFLGGISVLADRRLLSEELIRLHVVANSDREDDQLLKLKVRDAVIQGLQEDLKQMSDVDAARNYLLKNISKIQSIANKTLNAAGVEESAVVTLCRETFDVRHYDTFSLPAGVYESLRIVIGEGKGKNWWCVAFPALCLPATVNDFKDMAVGAGFSEDLCSTLSGDTRYEFRFFLLDAMGRLENILFEG